MFNFIKIIEYFRSRISSKNSADEEGKLVVVTISREMTSAMETVFRSGAGSNIGYIYFHHHPDETVDFVILDEAFCAEENITSLL